MTVYKRRTRSFELEILTLLDERKGLPASEKRYYYNLAKGYEGELAFDHLIEQLHCDCLILNDLLFNVNHTSFQIDTLIVTLGKIYMYEVKNFDGDYYYEADRLFKKPKYEVSNPLHQLVRSESLLRQLLLRNGFNFHIEAFIVFINSAFTLYQAPLNKPIIFPTQVNQHMKNLNGITTKLTARETKVADQLLSLHNPNSPYKRIPTYDYYQLEKGMICTICRSIATFIRHNKCICSKCNHIESTTDAVLRSVEEFKKLFPDKTITTNIIYDWCKIIPEKRTIRRILLKNFKTVGTGRGTSYK